MTEARIIWLLLVIVTEPIWGALCLFAITGVYGWYIGEQPENLDLETLIECMMFGYCHFFGKPVLCLGNQKWAQRIYGIANQRVYRNANGNLVVTPQESDHDNRTQSG